MIMDIRFGRTVEVLKRLPAAPCTAVEVGVFLGEMSGDLLSHHPHMILYMVDMWSHIPGNTAYAQSNDGAVGVLNADPDGVYRAAMANTETFRSRRSVIRSASIDAALSINDASMDLVFIDAEHTMSGCLVDCMSWWPKVRPGGWLGGHDYQWPGVAQAVDAFAKIMRLSAQHGQDCT